MNATSRVALVTGASRGIGRAIAIKLAEAGIDVAIGYEKNRVEAEDVVQYITALGRRPLRLERTCVIRSKSQPLSNLSRMR